jgi:hypothetical protein
MGKTMLDADSGGGISLFEQRRKLRRVRMIVDITSALISRDASMTYREARSLVDCAEKAIVELLPTYRLNFDLNVRPTFDRIIRERWPFETVTHYAGRELVN